MQKVKLRLALVALLVAVGCVDHDYGSEFAPKLAALEAAGIDSPNCDASHEYRREHTELFPYGKGTPPILEQIRAAARDPECASSQRLFGEKRVKTAVFRTYRCHVRGKDIEIVYSVEYWPRTDEIYTACSFAMSGPKPFQSRQPYIQYRRMD